MKRSLSTEKEYSVYVRNCTENMRMNILLSMPLRNEKYIQPIMSRNK